jgi:hypothetical protein
MLAGAEAGGSRVSIFIVAVAGCHFSHGIVSR